MWVPFGWLGGICVAYAIGKSLIPDSGLLIATATVLGGGIIGAIFGKIANG